MFEANLVFLAQGSSAPPNPPPSAPPNPPPADVSATTGTGGTSTSGLPSAQPSTGTPGIMLMVLVFLGVMFLMSTRTSNKEKKKREALINSLKKGDKVHTIGGVIGTVVEVRDSEVVLKVDDSNNTRIHYLRSAIQSVIEEKPETTEKSS